MQYKPQNLTDRQTDRQTDRRYHSIDFVKGICILFVIITHCEWQDAERLKFLFPFWIEMAVPVFMVISGFVYAKSFQKNGIDTIDKAYTVDVFLGKIIRYSVPFIIVFSIEEIAYNVFGGVHHSIAQIGISFLSGGFGPGSYYYPIMLQFIFFFPVIYAIIRKYGFNGLVLCGLINLIYEILKRAYGMNEECYRLLLFRYTLLIAYGCYLATDNYKRRKKLSVVCVCVGAAYIVVCNYFGVVPPITNFWTVTSFWACLFIIPISAPIILNKVRNQFIEILGRASYNIFLVQMVYFDRVGIAYKFLPYRLLQLIINLVVCVTVGVVFYYVETPITKVVHNKIYDLWNRHKGWQMLDTAQEAKKNLGSPNPPRHSGQGL